VPDLEDLVGAASDLLVRHLAAVAGDVRLSPLETGRYSVSVVFWSA
jgi:hypothetical protein